MAKVAELLERKKRLLERLREKPNPEQLLEIQKGLKEIDEALNRIETEHRSAAPDGPREAASATRKARVGPA